MCFVWCGVANNSPLVKKVCVSDGSFNVSGFARRLKLLQFSTFSRSSLSPFTICHVCNLCGFGVLQGLLALGGTGGPISKSYSVFVCQAENLKESGWSFSNVVLQYGLNM